MMTTARVATDTAEFIRTNFNEEYEGDPTQLWESGSITTSSLVVLPVGHLCALVETIADGKTIVIRMTLSADSLLTTTAFYDQTEIRSEELVGYLAYHKDALMALAHEFIDRPADAPSGIPLDPAADQDIPF